MAAVHRHLFTLMWVAWFVYWWLAAADTKAAVRRESLRSRAAHGGPLLLAWLLLALPPLPWLRDGARLLPDSAAVYWTGAALTACGLLFSVWARVHIGRNWSGIVTLKAQHELVTSGPYAWVRHPIYSGLILAFAGSAIARADWRGVLAVVIVVLALWRKLKLEESWMQQQFGDAYTEYRRRVAALLPFVRVGGCATRR